MPRMAVLYAALSALLCAAAPAAAAVAPPPAGETACSFGAFVNETDPAGLNVRAGPGTEHKVLGTLPPIRRSADDPPIQAMVEVEVVAGAGGWFKIRAAQDNTALIEGPPRPMYRGSGWVSGRKLTVKSQALVGRERPDAKAAAVLRGRDDMSVGGLSDDSPLLGCSGRWALVEFGPFQGEDGAETTANLEIEPAAKAGLAPGRFRAWVDRLCALQETSCDGA